MSTYSPRRSAFPRKTGLRATALSLILCLAFALALPLAAFPGGTAQAASSSDKLFLGYWANWGSDRPNASLSANLPLIDLYSPYWYTLQSSGNLSSRESGHAALTSEVHAAGQKVIPLINKTSSNVPLTDPATRSRAVENIYQMLVNNGFDGVDIDFEGMAPSTRAGVTAFMNELAARLRPAGLLVTMAVPAKWSADDSTNDFSACFDYAALGQAVDYLVIMTYDQHGSWSAPGPVAGADWVENVINYATTVVPAEKILLGIAGYGYNWSSAGFSETEAWSAPDLAARYGATIEWDDATNTPYFTYWASGVRHDVWYENSYSVDFKIDLINRYNLAGAALWALGQEDSRFWQVIAGTAGFSGGLGGTPSTPAADSGNNDGNAGSDNGSSSGSGAGAVAAPGDTGSGSGTPASSGPTAPTSSGSHQDAAAGTLGFADVPSSYWAYDTIMRLAAAGVVDGVSPTTFEPGRPITRGEFAALLNKAFDLADPPVDLPAFRDVPSGDWYYGAVMRAVAAGYMVGVDQDLFAPKRYLTRQEAAVIAARIASAATAATGGPSLTYEDGLAVATWAVNAVAAVTDKSLMSGYPDNTFRPGDPLTRVEAAVLIGRLRP